MGRFDWHVSLTIDKNTLMSDWAAHKWNGLFEYLWDVNQHWVDCKKFCESADFFMDQTYFSVCSYVIVKDMYKIICLRLWFVIKSHF